MQVVIISQARMGSKRLPGKVLKEVLGKPLLAYHLERLQRVTKAHSLLLATTTEIADDAIVALCQQMQVNFFRGSQDDVLARYYHAAIQSNANIIVRVTSDCPLIDPKIVDAAIDTYLNQVGESNYLSLKGFPRGLDVEICSMSMLSQAHHEALLSYEREHVMPFFYLHPQRYHCCQMASAVDYSTHRWTVDTEPDFQLIKNILEELYPKNSVFGLQDLLACFERHPYWQQINAHIQQKSLKEC